MKLLENQVFDSKVILSLLKGFNDLQNQIETDSDSSGQKIGPSAPYLKKKQNDRNSIRDI